MLEKIMRFLRNQRGSVSLQTIGLIAVCWVMLIGAEIYIESQGKGPIGAIASAIMQDQVDLWNHKGGGEVDYPQGVFYPGPLGSPQPVQPAPPKPVPTLWDRFLDWLKFMWDGIKVGLADIANWWNGVPDWVKGGILAVVVIAVIAIVVIAVLLAIGAAPILLVLALIGGILGIIGAGAMAIWCGVSDAGGCDFWESFLKSTGIGLILFTLPFVIYYGWPLLVRGATAAWGWLTRGAIAAWGWLTRFATATWGLLTRAATAVWGWLTRSAVAAWGWLTRAAAATWGWLTRTALPWLRGRALPWLWQRILRHRGALLGHTLGYLLVKVFIIDIGINHTLSSPIDYALDIGFIVIGTLFAPAWVTEGTLVAKGAWSAIGGVARAAVGQFQTHGISFWAWNWGKILESGAVHGGSRVIVGGTIPDQYGGSFWDRVVRTLIGQRDKWIPQVMPTQTPGSVTPTPNPMATVTPAASSTGTATLAPSPLPTPSPPVTPSPSPATTGTSIHSTSAPAPSNTPVSPEEVLESERRLRELWERLR